MATEENLRVSGSLIGDAVQALDLARLAQFVCARNGLPLACLITSMESPLGSTIGSWLEVKEATRFLAGEPEPDLEQVVTATVALVLMMAKKATSIAEGVLIARQSIASHKPLEKWRQMLAAQGGDLRKFDRWMARDTGLAAATKQVPSPCEGYVSSCSSQKLGEVVSGFSDPRAGIDQLVRLGSKVGVGEPLARIHAQSGLSLRNACKRVLDAFAFSPAPISRAPLVHSILLNQEFI